MNQHMDQYPDVFIHPAAIVEAEAVGAGTRIWAFCNIMRGSSIGRDCQICDRVFIESGAILDDEVTVKCGVSVWDGIELRRGVFVGPGVMFTNDPAPRSGRHLAQYPRTIIEEYASLGAGAVLLPGVKVGAYAMIGAGAVVTRDVEAFALVVGNPARRKGWVCVCGRRLRESSGRYECEERCGREFGTRDGRPSLLAGNPSPKADR